LPRFRQRSFISVSEPVLGIDIGGGSVKAAGVLEGRIVWTARSSRYAHPTRDCLVRAIGEAVGNHSFDRDRVGLCCPGLLDERKERVTRAVNLPALQGTSLADLVHEAIGRVNRVVAANDANAAGWDIFTAGGFADRMLCLVIGTGVGAAVADPSGLLFVDGESPGHLGQMDVSLEGAPVIGPDGGAGSLEGYLSSAAISRRYGSDHVEAFRTLRITDPPILALVRAIRICHAVYRPRHVCLAGGIGTRLAPLLPDIKRAVDLNLTIIARKDWDLSTGQHDHHAAAGAAKLASREA
jgi:predicted NBD/HSP70 family sugar kinase